jgi:hypothetical protein
MSNPLWENVAVMNSSKVERKRVTLEPELEAIAGDMGAFDRIWLAMKLMRWAHQLIVSSRALRARPWSRRRPVYQRADVVKWN